MELSGIIPVIRRWGIVIVMATVVAGLAGLLIGSNASPTYEARTSLLIGPVNADFNTQRASGALAQTYATIATSNKVVTESAREAGLRTGDIRDGLRANGNDVTRVLTIRARHRDAVTAQTIANLVASNLRDEITTPGTFQRPEGQLAVLEAARRPSSPIAPRLELIVPLAALAGLLGALALVLLIEYMSDSAKTAEDVEGAGDVNCLSTLTLGVRGRRSPLLASSPQPTKLFGDYRFVATHLELGVNQPLRAVVVAGIYEGDGSGVVALNLATVFAGRRRRVTLLDAVGEEVGAMVGLDDREGLAELLSGKPGDVGRIEPEGWTPFDVLPAGQGRGLESISLENARRVIDELSSGGGLVVIHVGSPLLSAGALVWARAADVTLLSVRRDRAKREAIAVATGNLRQAGANLVGAVLSDAGPVPQPPESLAVRAPGPFEVARPEPAKEADAEPAAEGEPARRSRMMAAAGRSTTGGRGRR
jgi:capsular polysaccharide biosynthesis protein